MIKDLVLLVADKNIDYSVRGLLSRPHALGIREVEAQTFIHLRRDPGCVHGAHEFLRPFNSKYNHALVLFDRQGSGREHVSAEALSEEVRVRLSANGWNDRAEVIVLDPELEVWVFAASPQVDRCLGWPKQKLRPWLERQNLWQPNEPKPRDPKEAMERALREMQKPRSSAIYQDLGERVDFRECVDPAFHKFRETLAKWFPLQGRS